jgi:hypothetical protein
MTHQNNDIQILTSIILKLIKIDNCVSYMPNVRKDVKNKYFFVSFLPIIQCENVD